MRGLARFMDARNTTEGKFLSVLLSLLLVFSFLNITMFTDLANADEDEAVAQSEELQEAADEAGDKKAEESEGSDQEPEGESGEVEISDPEGVVGGDGIADEAPGPDATFEDTEDSEPTADEGKSDTAIVGGEATEDADTKDVQVNENTASTATKKEAARISRSSKGSQNVYCYGLRPGGNPGSNNADANWLGLKLIQVYTEPSTDYANGTTRQIQIAAPLDLGNVTLDGKQYKYAAPGSENEDTAGFYTVEWNDYISVCGGANAGYNNYFKVVPGNADQNNTYHLDGVISINDTSKFNVGFKVKQPNGSEFSLLDNYWRLVEQGASPTAPSKEDVPDRKTEGGAVYVFDGWYLDEACTNKVDVGSYAVESNVSFYGKYVPLMSTVTYEYKDAPATADKLPVETSYQVGSSVPVASAPNTISGYTFSGWKADGVEVRDGVFTMPEGHVTFVGTWVANKAEIVFDANGGENAPASIEGVTGAEIIDEFPIEEPSREGYIFKGWKDVNGEDVTSYPSTFPVGTTTYYAQWERDTTNFEICDYTGAYDGHPHTPEFRGNLLAGEKLQYAKDDLALVPVGEEWLDFGSSLLPIHVSDSGNMRVRVVDADEMIVWTSDEAAAVTITPRSVTMELSNQTKTYDGSNRLTNTALHFTEKKGQGNNAGTLPGEGITASLNTRGSAAVTYNSASVHANKPLLVNGADADVIPSEMVTVTKSDNTDLGDYDITFKSGNGTINQSTEIDGKLDVVFEGKEKLYDGKPTEIDPAVVSPSNEDVTVKYALQSPRGGEGEWVLDPSELEIVDAGSYIVVAKVTSPNYEGSKEVRATFTINKRALKLVGESRSGLVYDGIEHHFTDVTAKDNGYADGQYANVTYSVAGTDAGEYTGAFSPASAADVKVYKGTGQDVTHNYTIELIPGTLTIEKASGNRVFAVNFADAKAQTLVYDGQPHEVTATAVQPGSTIEYTQTPEIETSWSSVPPRFENAGTYEVFVRATHPNYITTPSVKATLVIQKRAVAITGASLESKEYDGVESSTTDYKVEAENGDRGLVKRAKVEGVNYELKGTDAGTYQGDFSRSFIQIKTATGEVLNRNYRVELVRGALEITKRPYTVTTGSATKSYDGAALTNNEVVVAGLVEGETVDVRTTGSITEVGSADNTYTLTWTGTANEDNYEFDGHTLGKLEVVEAEYGIEVHGYVGPYDGTDHGVAVEAPEGATVTFSTDNVYRDVTDGAVEVAYTITRPNYRTITGTAVIQINPRPVTITVNSASKFVGAADPVLTGTVDGVVAGETLGVTYARANTDEAAGIYRGALTAFYMENPNYAVTVVPGTFTILPTAPIPGTPGGITPDPEPTTPAPTTPTVPTVPTPTVPTPTPAAPAPAPAPAAATPPATPTVVTPAPAAAEPAAPAATPEVIDDDATPQAATPQERTPLAETEEIADEETPMGAFDEPHCWVHWVMLLGIVLTAIYAVIVVRRRLSLTNDIDDYENQILGRVSDSESVSAHAASQQAL